MNGVGPLLAQLEASKLSGHLQHLTIRLSRQFAQVLTSASASLNDQHEQWTRLRGRLEEIEEELREAAVTHQMDGTGALALTEQTKGYLDFAERAKTTREQLEQELLRIQVTQPRATPGRSTPSRDVSSSPEPRPRKARPAPTAFSSAEATTAHAALESLLQSSSAPAPPSASSAHSKASALSSAFTLHLLANSPSTVLPPNQSLSSLLRSQLHQDPTAPSVPSSAPPSLQDRISSSVRTAYFAEALEDLSTGLEGLDSAAASRVWKQLRLDLWTSAGPLIPARLGGGSVKREVELALTSDEGAFELAKAMKTVRSVVELLGKLCAPARDEQVRALLSALSHSASSSAASLVEGVRGTLLLTEGMQDDLSVFRKNVAGATMSDEELEEMVRREAGVRERKVVKELLEEETIVEQRTKEWVEGKLGEHGAEWAEGDGAKRKDLLKRAMWEALFEDQAVSVPPSELPVSGCSDPFTSSTSPTIPSPRNYLPPPFYVPSPRLFVLQNSLQALVILACLAHLFPPPPPAVPSTSSPSSAEPTLQSRLWTLLSSTSSPETQPSEYTHLAHISDDILAAWKVSRSSSLPLTEPEAEAESTRIRTSVDRILRYEDPVFRLMKGRLREGLLQASWMPREGEWTVPKTMASGRAAGSGLSSPFAQAGNKRESERNVVVPPVKGFEGVFVREKVEEAAREGLGVWEWAGEVWSEELGLKRLD